MSADELKAVCNSILQSVGKGHGRTQAEIDANHCTDGEYDFIVSTLVDAIYDASNIGMGVEP